MTTTDRTSTPTAAPAATLAAPATEVASPATEVAGPTAEHGQAAEPAGPAAALAAPAAALANPATARAGQAATLADLAAPAAALASPATPLARQAVTLADPAAVPASPAAVPAGPAAALAAGLDGPLVSTQWLADHLGADGLVVLDATVVPSHGADGRPTYLSGRDRFVTEGHIPGSVFADLLEAFSDPAGRFPFTRPEAAAFEAAAAALGIGADTTVVVADGAVGQWAARLWYLFRSFGHDRVAVLDGGVNAWRTEGRPLDQGDVQRPALSGLSPLVALPRPGFWASTEEVAAIVAGTSPGALVCGTPPRDFAARHIPGSVSAPAVRLVDRETNTLLPERELRSLFADVLDAPGPIVVYCGAGIAAAADALALGMLGRDDVLLYDGSLSEWAADPAAPLTSAA